MHLELHQRLEQKQILTPALRQAMHVLRLNNVELAEHIKNMAEENPFLEIVEDNFPVQQSLMNAQKSSVDAQLSQDISLENSFNNSDNSLYSQPLSMEAGWERNTAPPADSNDRFSSQFAQSSESDMQAIIENSLSYQASLEEHLNEQLPFLFNNEQDEKIARTIISTLDKRGFLSQSVALYAKQLRVSVEHIERILQVMHTMDPVGIAARDVQESLLIQAKNYYPEEEILHQIIMDYFFELNWIDPNELAKSLKISKEKYDSVFALLKTLTPHPAAGFNTEPVSFIAPDITVRIVKGKPVITLNDQWIPRVSIDQESVTSMKQLNNANQPEVWQLIETNLENARSLIWSLEQRQRNLLKLMEVLVEMQMDFFIQGPEMLKPLRMQTIAERLKIHPSSVSRALSGKYLDSEWGIFPLKYLFPRAMTINNEDSTRQKIMKKINDLISNEEEPLGDEAIASILSQNGSPIARRTVAKYRAELGIPIASARQRLRKNPVKRK